MIVSSLLGFVFLRPLHPNSQGSPTQNASVAELGPYLLWRSSFRPMCSISYYILSSLIIRTMRVKLNVPIKILSGKRCVTTLWSTSRDSEVTVAKSYQFLVAHWATPRAQRRDAVAGRARWFPWHPDHLELTRGQGCINSKSVLSPMYPILTKRALIRLSFRMLWFANRFNPNFPN